MTDVVRDCVAKARRIGGRVVLPEGDDARITAAARRLVDERIAEPVVLGEPGRVASVAGDAGIALDGVIIEDPAASDRTEAYAEAYVRARPKTRPGAAARQLRKPLFYGGMMVRCGDADAMLAGAVNPTSRVIKAASLTIGPSPGVQTPSSYFVMALPEGLGALLFSDCAFNVEPDAAALADIALASASSARKVLGATPRVAILGHTTLEGDDGPLRPLAVEAAALARDRSPDVSVEGGLDVPSALEKRSNVLVFPDLATGNIAYKLTQYLAGADAIGPFLQGFAKPVSDLSRGASVDDIVAAAAVMLATAR